MFIRELSPKRYWPGTEIPVGRERGRLYITLHCHRHGDSCTERGSDERHFNVLSIVRSEVTKTVPLNYNF